VLEGVTGAGRSVLVLGLEELGDESWAVLAAAGVRLARVASASDAVRALTDDAAEAVIADARQGPALAAAVRARHELASTHIVICAALDSPHELREALAAAR
jgi:hypothetical protein